MRSWLLLSIAVGTGCASEPAQPAGTDPIHEVDGTFDTAVVPAGECVQTLSLYGMAGSQPTIVPVSLSPAGITLCLELDGRDNIQVAHFAASTPYEMGDASSYVLSLFEDDGTTLIRSGWDVTFGTTPTTVFANLEAGMPKGQVTYAKLVVATRTGETSSEVHLYLFEPYE